MATQLGVNIDHVATLRQVRAGREPEPVAAALAAQNAGAHGIVVHLRADRRHVTDRDVRLLKELLSVPLNVECAATTEMLEVMLSLKPQCVTLIPEVREDLVPSGGLDVSFLQNHLRPLIREYHLQDIKVGLFIDAQLEQVKMASRLEVDTVEFNTGPYANMQTQADQQTELDRLREASRLAGRLGMRVLAGRGLNRSNVGRVSAIADIEILNIGHSIVSRAILAGMERSVREMLDAMAEAV